METLLKIIALPCVFIAPIAAWMAFSFLRDGERKSGLKAAAVFLVSASILVVARAEPNVSGGSAKECTKDWDGFSNSEIC